MAQRSRCGAGRLRPAVGSRRCSGQRRLRRAACAVGVPVTTPPRAAAATRPATARRPRTGSWAEPVRRSRATERVRPTAASRPATVRHTWASAVGRVMGAGSASTLRPAGGQPADPGASGHLTGPGAGGSTGRLRTPRLRTPRLRTSGRRAVRRSRDGCSRKAGAPGSRSTVRDAPRGPLPRRPDTAPRPAARRPRLPRARAARCARAAGYAAPPRRRPQRGRLLRTHPAGSTRRRRGRAPRSWAPGT